MKRNEFDRDLDTYLHARRKGKRFNLSEFIQRIVPKPKHDDIDIEIDAQADEAYNSYEDAPTVHEKQEHHHTPEPTERKEGVFSRFFKREPAQDDQTFHELKEVSKIALNAIRQLPDDELREFKQSADFARLKEILQKHDLIK